MTIATIVHKSQMQIPIAKTEAFQPFNFSTGANASAALRLCVKNKFDISREEALSHYRELGLDVPVRGDHVSEMAYDRVLTPDGTPGYFTLGRLFANGYLKALLKSIA